MNPIRKLEIANWNQGKGCKGSRKAKLRAQTQSEIDEQIAEQDEAYRVKYRSTGHPNFKARLEYRINWYEQTLQKYEQRERSGHGDSFMNYLRDGLRKAKEEFEREYGGK